MTLTDNELSEMLRFLEAQAWLDKELIQRCDPLLQLGLFDEAARSAFVLLEERLRKAVNGDGMTRTQLVSHAFDPRHGLFAKHLTHSQAKRESLHQLYLDAFNLYPHPPSYCPTQTEQIIGLVSMLLKILERGQGIPPMGIFPDTLEP